MAYKYITTYISAGYTITGQAGLYITPTGGVGGTGIFAPASAGYERIFNEGFVNGHLKSDGIELSAGGFVTNGVPGYTNATIKGQVGVLSDNLGRVTNFGTIEGLGFQSAGIVILGTGTVVNGSAANGTALIEGAEGVSIRGATGTLINYGAIESQFYGAVYFTGGGLVTNGSSTARGATIAGEYGVAIRGHGTVANFGTIKGLNTYRYSGSGVYLKSGGNVINGSGADTTALIEGDQGVFIGVKYGGTVTNYGSIVGLAMNDGVLLNGPGAVTNGSATDHVAAIIGYTGVVEDDAGSIANFGTIEGLGSTATGVTLAGGGLVTNGSGADTAALISGAAGVKIGGTLAGTVNNYGSIVGSGGAAGAGVAISGSGRVFNGLGGLIEGGAGVSLTASGFIQNNGTIRGQSNSGYGGAGVVLAGGGQVINGLTSDHTALISGDYGVFIRGLGTVANFATITAEYHSAGVELYNGGLVTNGSTRDATAAITGYDGVKLLGAASLANFGTVAGGGGYGVWLFSSGESVTNGSAGHGRATLSGYIGVEVNYGAVTVNNFGTISGYGGTALAVYAGASVLLEVEAGSAFQGAVLGNRASTLDLASGTGTLSALSGTAVTVSGSMAATTFSGFGTVEAGAGAVFTVTGKATVLAGQTLAAAGTLTASGAIANAGVLEALGGTLIVSGAVTGAGSAAINGGTLDFASSFNQAVTFGAGGGTLELAQSQSFTANVTGFSRTSSTSLDLLDIGFVSSTEATFSGTKTGGILTVTDGTHTAHISLKGNYLTATFVASSDGRGGTIVVDPKTKTIASPHQFIAAMAGMAVDAGVTVHASADETRRAGVEVLARPAVRAA